MSQGSLWTPRVNHVQGLLLDVGGVLVGPGSDPSGLSVIVRQARSAGVAVGIVSNDPGGASAQWLRDLGGGVFVDDVVLSGDVGMIKPDAEIYLLAARRLGLQPSECVFVDDLDVNIRGAVSVGMVGVHHRDPSTAIEELMILLGLDETALDETVGVDESW